MIIIKKLFRYPIKSTRGTSSRKLGVLSSGFENDRKVAVVNRKDKIVTGREASKLLHLKASISDEMLSIEAKFMDNISFQLPNKNDNHMYKLFRNDVTGIPLGRDADLWISQYLGGHYRLIHLGRNTTTVQQKRGGALNETKNYADSSPVHLINAQTLLVLNERLKNKVHVRNFRPNIVVGGAAAFEEDSWKLLEISGIHYRVQERTNRCVFTTIDPETGRQDNSMEPLKRLASIRLRMGMRPTFGIGLVPLSEGTIEVGSEIKNLMLH